MPSSKKSRGVHLPRLTNKKAVGIIGLPTASGFAFSAPYLPPNGQTMTKKYQKENQKNLFNIFIMVPID
jgi:hypothetical protein